MLMFLKQKVDQIVNTFHLHVGLKQCKKILTSFSHDGQLFEFVVV